MSLNRGFISFYGDLSAEQIVKKLNQPKIEIQKSGGILTYLQVPVLSRLMNKQYSRYSQTKKHIKIIYVYRKCVIIYKLR